MKYQILNGDNIEILKTLPENSIDSIITDPPYGIAFLGKEWDHKRATETTSKIAQLHNLPSGMKHTTLADDLEFQYWLRERWIECLRVLKPGGHVLAFSAARTYHHMAMSLQTAGFEIRDQIMWIYSSGFPKSQDVGRTIQRGLGVKEKTKLKSNGPANGLSRMTFNQSDPAKFEETKDADTVVCTDPEAVQWQGWGTALKPAHEPICMARKPMKLSIAKNCQQWGTGALNIDATRIERDNEEDRFPSNVIGEIPDYQKYFYCPKVSRRERHTGFDTSVIPTDPSGKFDRTEDQQLNANERIENKGGNNHPTVKPVELMKYLIKLVTPPNGRVLDPFNGSGSTGMAAVELGYEYIGIEQDEKYCEISRRRIEGHLRRVDPLRASGLFE